MQEKPLISVIVPILDEAAYIRHFLHCLLQQDYPRDKTEIILVDGGSTDGTLQILQQTAAVRPELKLLHNPRKFVPHALNIGLDHAAGEIIIRMDAHAIYPSDYLSSLVYWLQATQADNVGGIWQTRPGTPEPQATGIALALASPFGVGNAAYRIGASLPVEVDTVPFGCYKKEVFQRFGRFDPDLHRNQDDEFNARLIQAGGRIMLIPQIKIDYYARSSLKSLASKMYQYGYFKPLVNKKLGRPATWRQFAPPGLVMSLTFIFFLSLLLSTARYALIGLCLLYVLFLVLGTLHARPARISSAAWTLLAMAVMHFSYGCGYLLGVWQHWLSAATAKSSNADGKP